MSHAPAGWGSAYPRDSIAQSVVVAPCAPASAVTRYEMHALRGAQLDKALAILDRQLASHSFIAGESVSLVDICFMASRHGPVEPRSAHRSRCPALANGGYADSV
jgi:glutathione S-transferase